MIRIFIIAMLLQFGMTQAQSAWPSESWNSGVNLTAVMDANGVQELSGMHWNPLTNRLYLVQNDGRLRVLQLNTSTNVFTQLASKILPGGPEGITQVDFSADEFYIMDENNYLIRRLTHSATYTNITEAHHWDILASPSTMEDTGNTGPEGIVFIPDASLSAAGFISSQTGAAYTSIKGMGGLMFVAHQDEGYVWVFDLNPNVDDDFAFVGKYKTSRSESCDLAFDRTTGLLYILHNIDDNYLEVTNLSTATVSGEKKFVDTSEYFIPTPPGANINIEGFAITPKCPDSNNASAWLCRDVSSGSASALLQDAVRWFNPFTADGNCVPLGSQQFTDNKIKVYPNPAGRQITVSTGFDMQNASIQISDALGQVVLSKENYNGIEVILNVSALQNGLYILEIRQGESVFQTKWIKG
ncbi:MAG TPA: T9SS type A sorting domain-containing protein [Flavobacterium sp.]|nr:T9SS type A sorting domain-containing protein [Flavobacterium sp.]